MTEIYLSADATQEAAGPKLTEAEWAQLILADLSDRAAKDVAIGKMLLEAKADLENRNVRTFTGLVQDRLGRSLDWAERLMQIARHPILSDSAHARSLPTATYTRAILVRLSPATLEAYLEEGRVHPALKRSEAEALVRANSSNGSEASPDNADEADEPEEEEDAAENTAGNGSAAPVDDPGPNSLLENERLRARNAELENIQRQLEIRLESCESEIAELKAKIAALSGPPEEIAAERRLFLRALRELDKAEAKDLDEKAQWALRNSVISDLIELNRTATRNGHKAKRFDLVYLPELH